MDIIAKTRSFILQKQLNTLSPIIISCSTTLEKLEKVSLAVWDNRFLKKRIKIHTKMHVCIRRVHAK